MPASPGSKNSFASRVMPAAGPGINVQPAFSRYLNTATSFFMHDVSRTSGIHLFGQADVGGFSGANRHVECEDCHNPHRTDQGSSTAPFAQPELAGITAVDPIWSAPGAPGSYTWMPSVEREYQVCFKCHSSFTAIAVLPAGRLEWDSHRGRWITQTNRAATPPR